MTNAPEAIYSAPARWLHWIMAIMILGLIPVGISLEHLGEGPFADAVYDLHKSFGMTVFALAVFRVAWRVAFGAPELPADVPNWQRVASLTAHRALYLLIFIVPIFGYVATSMCCKPIVWFWIWQIPISIDGGEDASKLFFLAHKTAAITLAAIIIVHFGAALYHLMIRRDGVFERMLPRRRKL